MIPICVVYRSDGPKLCLPAMKIGWQAANTQNGQYLFILRYDKLMARAVESFRVKISALAARPCLRFPAWSATVAQRSPDH
jgi:hypothetical protein